MQNTQKENSSDVKGKKVLQGHLPFKDRRNALTRDLTNFHKAEGSSQSGNNLANVRKKFLFSLS